MSEQSIILEVDKYITSELWYTALTIFQTNSINSTLNANYVIHCKELECLIEYAIKQKNEDQYDWIRQILLQKIIFINPLYDKRNVCIELNKIQLKNAINVIHNAPSYILKDLLLFDFVPNMKNCTSCTVNNLSEQTLMYLKKYLLEYPTIMCWIINELISLHSFTNSNVNDYLQDLYIFAFKEYVQQIISLKNDEENSTTNESTLFKSKVLLNEEQLSTVLCILSKMNLTESKKTELLGWLCPVLLKTYNIKDIELALYSRTNTDFINEWNLLVDQVYARRRSANTLENAVRIHCVIFSKRNDSIIVLNGMEIMQRVLKRQIHWTIDILDLCYTLVVSGKHEDVSLILSCRSLKYFWLNLLLKFLNECPQKEIDSEKSWTDNTLIVKSFKFLLQNCDFTFYNDKTLCKLNIILEAHVKVLNLILDLSNTNTSKETYDECRQFITSEQKLCAKQILYDLQNYSLLLVLRKTTNIHEMNHTEIQDLLRECGESEDAFKAYRSLLAALMAILLCNSYETKYEDIASYFFDMKFHLNSLYPLSLRLDTLENIFSLLFLHYDDFNSNTNNNNNNNSEGNISISTMKSEYENMQLVYSRIGFICNKYAIRDTLHHLKYCITSIKDDFEIMGKNNKSITDLNQIHNRITAFDKVLADANWRLEFYTNSDFIERIGINENIHQNSGNETRSDILLKEKLVSPYIDLQSKVFYQKDDVNLDETKVKSDDSSEIDFIYTNRIYEKYSRNITSVINTPDFKDANCKQLFVNLMLASKESLILQCLWKNNYAKAQEIIQISELKNTPLDEEIRFSKALRLFRQNILKHMQKSEIIHLSNENSQPSTLEAIRQVAQEGMQTSKHTNQFETFLASQETHLRKKHLNFINSNEILTLCVLDITLTMGLTQQISQSLCDVAMKYVKLYNILSDTEHSHFFFKIYQLLYEKKENLSVTNILCDANIPLSMKDWKEKIDFWSYFMKEYSEYKEVQRQKVHNQKCLQFKILKEIIDICNDKEKYLQNMQYHLQHLDIIVPNCTDVSEILTMSDLLNIPLHNYFAYQLFNIHIEPEELESVAYKLKVNLVHSILVSVCPKLPCYNNEDFNFTNRSSGCIILNENLYASNLGGKSHEEELTTPNQCISKILSELLLTLHDLGLGQSNLSYSSLQDVSTNSNIQYILRKTSQLATLDLSELSVGDETLTFFLNTWNVMFLHTMLTTWVKNPPFNNLRHTISLMSVGYVIGDLGLVTLGALRFKMLGDRLSESTLFTSIEELNELAWQDLDLPQDPRIIFAMANEFYGTPEIRVYEEASIHRCLDNAAHDYLINYLLMDQNTMHTENLDKETIITLPYLAQLYQNWLQESKSNTHITDDDKSLLSITDYLKIENDNYTIQYTNVHYSYEILLKYAKQSTLQNSNAICNTQTSIWQNRIIKPNLLQYLNGHCWLLSYLVQRMHNKIPTILNNNSKRTSCLENLLTSSWIEKLKHFFDNNETYAGICESVPTEKLWFWLKENIENKEWENCLNIINAILDNNSRKTFEIQFLKDKILSVLLSTEENLRSTQILIYLYQIKDIHILAQTLLCNISKWQVNVCEYGLMHAIHHVNSNKLPLHCMHQMKGTLLRVILFHKMLPYCEKTCTGTWYDVVYCTEKINPFNIIQSLISTDQFKLCLEWLECQGFSLEVHSSITQDILIGLLKNETQDFSRAVKLLQVLPLNQSLKICQGVLRRLQSIDALHFIVNYLLKHSKITDSIMHKKTLIGIDILKELKDKERSLYIHLIKDPLLMLEQLVMNCKFETIQKILNIINNKLQDINISITEFDKIIRFYAKKSLDFRVSFQREGIDNKSKNVHYSTLEIEDNTFIMPISVPKKEEWIPNDKARECSCCKAVIFSMFNRRHHCRRCGRVVCAVCSQHRMQVLGYPSSVLVRVCDDCKHQTMLQMLAIQGTSSVSSSEILDYWKLTKNETHNQTIREEFSFEYAPSISLCLAILNLHSDHKTYTRFLLDRCDEMKQLLQPVNGERINPEVDHIVIIKMIRALLLAVKVKCAKLGLNTGLAHCDRFLSQIDLIATFVHSDCLTLIPSDDLDEHALRKLRDLLTEKQQWTLALDVSTKSGLDTQGVWVAWGKACLKVGYFEQAREKFVHCLDKVAYDEVDDWVVLSYTKECTSEDTNIVTDTNFKKNEAIYIDEKINKSLNSKKNNFIKNRPTKNPPLLTEILQILNNLKMNSYTQYSYQKSNGASEILNTLNNLKAVSQGYYTIKNTLPVLENVYYEESLYYLLTYGSYNSILEFFLQHEQFVKCLNYTLEIELDPDIFFTTVYMYCLKTGTIEKLHEAMKTKDPSLLVWKKYLISICHNLERKHYLHTLYQLQLFMKDHVRAAMTCIRFYMNEANTYTDLCSKADLLLDAQKHLASELQIETLGKRKKSINSSCSGHDILTMEMEPSEIDKHINIISRQMEVAKFLGAAEKEGRSPKQFLSFFPDMDNDNMHVSELSTLFGNHQQKIHLAVLAILCGRDVEEGFGIAFRIMQDCNLPTQKIYSLSGHVLALKNNVNAIEQLIKCCRSSGAPNTHVISDYVLTHCVKLLLHSSYSDTGLILKNEIDILIRLITDIELKISAFIESKQLKAAYLLAVKYSRAQDIRKICKEADRLGQSAIKSICVKWLQQMQK